MRILGHARAALVLAWSMICAANAFAQDTISLTIYLASEQALCPGGYTQADRCSVFTGAKFDDLRKRGHLRLLATFPPVPVARASDGREEATIELGPDAISYARRCDSANPAVVLLVVEWVTPQVKEVFDNSNLFRRISRRSFNHGSMCRLDPENAFVWHFSSRNARLAITFQ